MSGEDEEITAVTPTGIKTNKSEYEFDIIVYATGFDAMSGAFDRIDFRGIGGEKLKEKWKDGPMTYVGAMVSGFPNLITLVGPQSGASSTNFPRAIEVAVDWATDLVMYLRKLKAVMNASPEAEEAWCEEAMASVQKFLLGRAKSWFNGFNSNVEDHDRFKPRPFIYYGGNPKYAARLAKIRDNGYEGIDIRPIEELQKTPELI